MWRVSSRPTNVQVVPASVDLNTPAPHGELLRLFGSPVPTYKTSGLERDRPMSPIDAIGCSSKSGSHVIPAFTVFHTPPVAVPM
jgi:hypothetical protein